MASLLLMVGVLSYDQIKKQKAKRAAKEEHNSARFSELEAENARRIAALQNGTCFCQTSDWKGGGCERHGYVPAAGELGGPPLVRKGEDGEQGEAPPPGYEERASAPRRDATLDNEQHRPYGEIEYQHHSGEEDGSLADIPYLERVNQRRVAPLSSLPNREGHVDKINKERRRTMKVRGFANWRLKKKVGRGEAVVR